MKKKKEIKTEYFNDYYVQHREQLMESGNNKSVDGMVCGRNCLKSFCSTFSFSKEIVSISLCDPVAYEQWLLKQLAVE